jgi:hypothetical protein
MKRTFLFLSVILFTFTIMSNSSCEDTSSDAKLNSAQEGLMLESNAQVGMPGIKNFQEKKLLKLILEIRDQTDLICYCYIVPEMTGKPVFLGKCIGYGLPYATQYTSPLKLDYKNNRGYIPMPQADPNGLFMPASAEGTWVLLINPKTNEPKPIYVETRVLISPFEL